MLALSGTYAQLLDYATFGDWLACAVGVATPFWYRRHDAGATGFRVPDYPWLPLLLIGVVAWVVVTTMLDNPRNAGIGVLIMLAGVPCTSSGAACSAGYVPKPRPAMPQYED